MNRRRDLTLLLACGLLAAVLAAPQAALADGLANTDTVPRLVHYEGTLEKDGAAVTGDQPMIFRIFDGANPVWNESQTVKVYAGRFSVLLGSTSATSASNLASTISAADDLYLGVALVVDGSEVTLTNRQRFTPVPFSLWTTSTATLKVGANIEISGTDVKFQPHAERGDGGRALVHGTNDTLTLNYNGDFSGGVTIGDPPDPSTSKSLYVNGPTHVSGVLSAAGEVQAQGGLYVTGAADVSGAATVGGNLTVSGTAKLGLTVKNCPGTGTCVCPAGTTIIGGGGDCGGSAFLHESYPVAAENRWQVYCNQNGAVAPDGSYAICARIGQ